jgi:biopolymer transport protein ExbD
MRIRDDDSAEEFVINMTPVIDVVFLLMIFFMLATTYMNPEKQLELDLPRAESGTEAKDLPEELVINVFKDGSMILSGQPVDQEGLRAGLERAARSDPEVPVIIRGDRDARHEAIVSVMDACGVVGLANLSVGTLDAAAR